MMRLFTRTDSAEAFGEYRKKAFADFYETSDSDIADLRAFQSKHKVDSIETGQVLVRPVGKDPTGKSVHVQVSVPVKGPLALLEYRPNPSFEATVLLKQADSEHGEVMIEFSMEFLSFRVNGRMECQKAVRVIVESINGINATIENHNHRMSTQISEWMKQRREITAIIAAV